VMVNVPFKRIVFRSTRLLRRSSTSDMGTILHWGR
jgi:hypothetical protein